MAICSYRREVLLQERTLKCLRDAGVPSDRIYIFVADEDQKRIYESALRPLDFKQLVVARLGLAQARNYVLSYFPIGTPILFCDDDIQAFKFLLADGSLGDGDLLSAINTGFTECQRVGASLWGVSPVPNGFFMRHTVSTDLKFCVGAFFGMINPGSEGVLRGIVHPPYSEKEDYIRTLQCWDRDGAIVRLNWLSVKTAYYKQEGGIETSGRLERERAVVAYIKNRWPLLVRDNPKRKSNFPEILLRKPLKSRGRPPAITEALELVRATGV